jgi:hypothetical protein
MIKQRLIVECTSNVILKHPVMKWLIETSACRLDITFLSNTESLGFQSNQPISWLFCFAILKKLIAIQPHKTMTHLVWSLMASAHRWTA